MPGPQRPIAILLMALGGPERLEDVEPYLAEVRGGRPMPPEFVEEIRERYRLTGGKSPVLGITREVARKLEQKLNGPGGERYRVYVGLRHWRPSIKTAYAELLDDFPERVIALCMAPHYSELSVGAYLKKLQEARAELRDETPLSLVKTWARHPGLADAFADAIATGLERFPAEARGRATILFTAHSLPARVLETGDPYPEEVRATVEAVRGRLGPATTRFAYQSQAKTSEPWLGPTVESVLEELSREGRAEVLVAPIGFLSDHVEILYDVDIHFKEVARSLGLSLERTPMLNASPRLVETLASVLEAHLASPVG